MELEPNGSWRRTRADAFKQAPRLAWNEMMTVHLVDAVRTWTPFYDYSFVRSSLLHARHRFCSLVLECALLVALTVAIELETLLKIVL